MKKLITTFLAITTIFLLGSTNATALPLDSYTLNFSAASGGLIPNIDNVDEIRFVGRSAIAFNDLDGSFGISAGDTFDDFFVIRATDFIDINGNDIASPGYGNNHELTLIGRASGVQTTDNNYVLTSLTTFNFYFDSGPGFTQADFTNLSTFADGVNVESGTLVQGEGSNDAGIISGTFDLEVDLIDILHTLPGSQGEFFELDDNGNPFNMNLVFGLVDSNNTQNNNIDLTVFENFFGFNRADYSFVVTGQNDGSFNKTVVPEPGTMLLLGFGLLGFAHISRRKS